MLSSTFKEQSKNWEDLTRAHVSNAILIVHHFIRSILNEACQDQDIRAELWNTLLDDLRHRYKFAMEHAEFILRVEFEGRCMTYNPSFNKSLFQIKMERSEAMQQEGEKQVQQEESGGVKAGLTKFWTKLYESVMGEPDSGKVAGRDIHDILQAYYDIARSRFVDTVCRQVIDYFLLYSPNGPLAILSDRRVLELSEDSLETIAGEDPASREKREALGNDIEAYEKALKVLRG